MSDVTSRCYVAKAVSHHRQKLKLKVTQNGNKCAAFRDTRFECHISLRIATPLKAQLIKTYFLSVVSQ